VAICRRWRTGLCDRISNEIRIFWQIPPSLLLDLSRLAARSVSIHPRKWRSASIRQFAIRVQFGSRALSPHLTMTPFNRERLRFAWLLLCKNWHTRRFVLKHSWEIIADNLSKAGWSWGWVLGMDSSGRTSISGIIPRPCSSRSRCLGRLCNRGSLC
jgi:hypothetical protein